MMPLPDGRLPTTQSASVSTVSSGAEAKPSGAVTISLPASKIMLEDLRVLGANNRSIGVILSSSINDKGQSAYVQETNYYTATLRAVLDSNGLPIDPPYEGATVVQVAIERGHNNAGLIKFVDQLSAASNIYLFPEP
jgi:hypothetical protein